MSATRIAAILFLSIGLLLGYSMTSLHYKNRLLEEAEIYKSQVEEARAKEKEWQAVAYKLDNEYNQKLSSIKSNNDALVARLRQQLNDASRVSSACISPSKSNDTPRRAEVSREVNGIIEFANQCSKRTDALIIQLSALQDWIKKAK